ncbi:uncharacterized protein LOC123005469 [Tribolium madens]|uniref:uncharacterized protein LOC123005469 n=1 Tax=Tribolium madens TaxID=41895 RepID=UPI001CF7435F|nr:uncharacterized protein LOC123005469 [Tribolium madens]
MHVKKILIPTIIALSFVGLCYGQDEPAPDPPSKESEESPVNDGDTPKPAPAPAGDGDKAPPSDGKGKEVKPVANESSKVASPITPPLPPSPFTVILKIILPGLEIPAPLAPVALLALLVGFFTPEVNVKVISFLLAVHFCSDIDR